MPVRTSRSAAPKTQPPPIPPALHKEAGTEEVAISPKDFKEGTILVIPETVTSGKRAIYASAGDHARIISILSNMLILARCPSGERFPMNRDNYRFTHKAVPVKTKPAKKVA